jgi:DNA-binding IclR family transcriptional regulator
LHSTALGKVFVAFSAPQERERLIHRLPLVASGPRTITDRTAFRKEIERVHESGWAIADEEHEEGVRSIAVPIMGTDDIAVAAISIVAPVSRGSAKDLELHLNALNEAANQLSVQLRSRSLAY